MKLYALIFLSFALWLRASAEQCGLQADGYLCPDGLCCSKYGWCGSTGFYCGAGCQSGQCLLGSSPPAPIPKNRGDVGKLITAAVFNQMLKYRDDPRCPGKGFYSYKSFLAAARSFYGFGTTGDDATRKRELAAFLAQTSHETTGGWETAPDGPYAWGYCFIRDRSEDTYCSLPQPTMALCSWPEILRPRTHPTRLAGKALRLNLLKDPDLVARDATVAFKTAIWFWMTPQGNKPSSHDVILGKWRPSNADRAARRFPGYGVITNIINGGVECGHGADKRVTDRIGFYKKYCNILGVSYGSNLDCNHQRAFG